jgi:hypothetical protein
VPKRDPTLEKLRALSALREVDADVTKELTTALAANTTLIINKAAEVVQDRHAAGLPLGDLREPLAGALTRLLDRETRDDDYDGSARLQLVRVMGLLGQESAEVLHRAARTVDWRGRDPKYVDVAAPLRGEAAVALARLGDNRIMPLLADLLFQPPRHCPPQGPTYVDDPTPRMAAAQALGHTNQPAASLLLRAKLIDDHDAPMVLAEAAGGLLRLAEPWAEAFVERWLARQQPDRLAEAVLPLAEANRLDLALPLWPRCRGTESAGVFLYNTAAARDEAAGAFLLSVVQDAEPKEARQAATALRELARDPAVKQQAADILAKRGIRG